MRGLSACFVVAVLSLVLSSTACANFGFTEKGLAVAILNRDGTPDTQAGSHPFAYSTTVKLNELPGAQPKQSEGGSPRDVEVELPAGLIGDPGAVPACSEQEFTDIH